MPSKAKTPKPPVETPQPSILPSLVDELGHIQQEARELVPEEIKARLKILGKKEEDAKTRLLAAREPPPDLETIVEGSAYTAVISPAANQRTVSISNAKLARMVDREHGAGTYVENASLTLASIEKLLPAEVTESIIESARTGRRTVVTAEKTSQKKAA